MRNSKSSKISRPPSANSMIACRGQKKHAERSLNSSTSTSVIVEAGRLLYSQCKASWIGKPCGGGRVNSLAAFRRTWQNGEMDSTVVGERR